MLGMFAIHRNKKGSVSVFVIIAFVAFMAVASVFFAAAKSAAAKSYADAAYQLAGRSVLSEYDSKLLKEYGIMAFKGDEKMIEDDIRYYAGASLESDKLIYYPYRNNDKEHTDAINYKMGSIKASLKEYSLLDVDNFREQIKSGFVTEWIKNNTGKKKRNKNAELSEEEDEDKGRKLRDESILAGLPSAAFDPPFFPSFDFEDDMFFVEGVINETGTEVLVNEYIINVFSNELNIIDNGERFFLNEVEYIISGAKSDVANSNFLYAKIFGIRMISNGIHIRTSSWKKATIDASAAIMAAATRIPEPACAATLSLAWATAESRNDLKLLMDGKKVPIWKTDSSWATKNVIEAAEGALWFDAVEPTNITGFDYEGYLRILLSITDRDVKILRIMDLIQINLKGSYYKEFLIREHYIGFRVECEYGNDKFSYIQKY